MKGALRQAAGRFRCDILKFETHYLSNVCTAEKAEHERIWKSAEMNIVWEAMSPTTPLGENLCYPETR